MHIYEFLISKILAILHKRFISPTMWHA